MILPPGDDVQLLVDGFFGQGMGRGRHKGEQEKRANDHSSSSIGLMDVALTKLIERLLQGTPLQGLCHALEESCFLNNMNGLRGSFTIDECANCPVVGIFLSHFRTRFIHSAPR